MRPKKCPDCADEEPDAFCQRYPWTCKERIEIWEDGYQEGYGDGYEASLMEGETT